MPFQRRYLDRLGEDLERWIAAGYVAAGQRKAILADAAVHAPQHSKARTAAMLTLLGVLLVGAGAVSFVAANWEQMPRALRLVVLFTSMIGAFAGGWWMLARAGRPQAGQGLILLGVILFGVDIHLVAQTYQIQAHYPNGVLLWAGGAVLAAVLVPSAPSLALAFALIGLWSWQEIFFDEVRLHLPFLPMWAVATAVAVGFRWDRCLAFGVVVFAGWYGLSGLALLARLEGIGPVDAIALLAVLPLVLWVGGEKVPRVGGLLHALGLIGSILAAAVVTAPLLEIGVRAYALTAGGIGAAAVVATWAWARPDRLRLWLALAVALLAPLRLALDLGAAPAVAQWGMVIAFLGTVIALAVLGGREGSPLTRRVAYTAFGLDILALYMGGTMSLLSLFVFFTVVGAGLVVSALRLEKRS